MEYFDTLSVYDRLSRAGLPDAASRELSDIFKDNYRQQLEFLATKRDIADVKRDIADVRKDIVNVKRDIADIRKDVAELKTTTETNILKSKNDTIKWVAGLMMAQAAIIMAGIGVMIKFLK
ncbi:MAG: hypothetical protein HQK56_03110 [Deltaproteobacteria bacterium]|nr:hypothetical protein [Deltaproteobacteria bacterium]